MKNNIRVQVDCQNLDIVKDTLEKGSKIINELVETLKECAEKENSEIAIAKLREYNLIEE